MWTKAAIRDNWPAPKVRNGIKDCIEHTKALGLYETFAGKELEKIDNFLRVRFRDFLKGGFREEDRQKSYDRLEVVKQFVADLAKAYEAS